MKIAYCSDLHLEFGGINFDNKEKADVLVLAGDICVAKDLFPFTETLDIFLTKSMLYQQFFNNCSKKYKHVIYVLGNHEHYHGDIRESLKNIKNCLKHIKNLHILERTSVVIDDVTFLGSTLWTDMNKGDEATINRVGGGMNDFYIIKNSENKREIDLQNISRDEEERLSTSYDKPAKWHPLDAIKQFNATVEWIDTVRELTNIKKLVVVTHHAPTFKSISPEYFSETLMNGGYASDLEQFIIDRPDILYWIHGHIHHNTECQVGSTKILANPRGYIGYESMADTFKLKYIEI